MAAPKNSAATRWKAQQYLWALILDLHQMRSLEPKRQKSSLLLELTSGAHRVGGQAEGGCQRQ
jgi:hypothetical protein